jgi:hypothetical protein
VTDCPNSSVTVVLLSVVFCYYRVSWCFVLFSLEGKEEDVTDHPNRIKRYDDVRMVL